MRTPTPRGPLTFALREALVGAGPVPDQVAGTSREDRALALWMLYELHFRGFDGVADDLEWSPGLLTLRHRLEELFETELRDLTAPLVDAVSAAPGDVVSRLVMITEAEGPSLSRYLHREADVDQYREFLALRSVYHLKESDPTALTLARVSGAAKAALAELLYDEYGGGDPAAVHQQLFADALVDAGLDPAYGAYVDQTPAHVLTVNNAMSFFGLHRRLRGASVGHLAAFEMTSSLPCRRYSQGAARLGLGPAVLRYYDEHVEADAVHEHLASRTICGNLVREDPTIERDILLGAAACILLEQTSAAATLAAWAQGRPALHREDAALAG